jgi:predicted phosphodiesterase
MSKKDNILVIGDIHEPFSLDGYREHCKEVYDKYNCNKVIFIGDIIDNHFGSYHEKETDAYGGKYELKRCIEKVAKWYELFPVAEVCIGNHDAIVSRKAQSGGIPEAWIRDYSDVLQTPGWVWATDFIHNNVRYTHGHKSSKARTAFKRDMMSTVTGHFHTDFYIEYNFGVNHNIFAMAVGSGVDDKAYAVRYAAGGKKSAIGCGVILNNGKLPILCPMNLKKAKKKAKKRSNKEKVKRDRMNLGYTHLSHTLDNDSYTFSYKENSDTTKESSKDTKPRTGARKTLVNVKTLEVYEKAVEVANMLGISQGHLSSMLNGRKRNTTDFEYLLK